MNPNLARTFLLLSFSFPPFSLPLFVRIFSLAVQYLPSTYILYLEIVKTLDSSYEDPHVCRPHLSLLSVSFLPLSLVDYARLGL